MSTNERYIALSDAAKPMITVAEGKFVFADDYVQTLLPETLTLESLKAAQQFESDLEAATLHAAGHVGADALKADGALEELAGKIQVGSTTLKVLQVRSASYPNPRRFEEGQPQRYEYSGEITARRNPAGGSAIKSSRDAVRAYAADIFG